jgi:hypothetical protein
MEWKTEIAYLEKLTEEAAVELRLRVVVKA